MGGADARTFARYRADVPHSKRGGSRHPAEAAHLKAQGVKSGVPDICLPVPRGGYHGLYIELKADGGKTSQKQREWIAALREQGYAAGVCHGCGQAIGVIEKYYGGKIGK